MDNTILKYIPEMLMGEELNRKLEILPDYDAAIVNRPATERLIALQDIFQIFIPTQMGREIYSKMYLALLRSIQKKQSILAVKQFGENAKMVRQKTYESIIGGSDAFTIIGKSGIGKSSAVSRAIRILTDNPIIEIENRKLITCLQIQCPSDCSIKGLLLSILQRTDELLDSQYYTNAIKAHSTVDMLIGSVSTVALNHLGLIVIDEIQNVVNNKNGRNLIGTLTQLINNSGVSICMVGTPECSCFFGSAMMLARRSIGLSYEEMDYGEEFKFFCCTMLKNCYVKTPMEVNEGLLMWLYNHSHGNASIVASLIYTAQEIAIMEGIEALNTTTLTMAYEQRLAMLHDYIQPVKVKYAAPKEKKEELPAVVEANDTVSIFEISSAAKAANKDILPEIKHSGICVVEVRI